MLINFRRNWGWIGYFLIPIILLIKIFLITFCIEIGVIFKGYKVSFKKIRSLGFNVKYDLDYGIKEMIKAYQNINLKDDYYNYKVFK